MAEQKIPTALGTENIGKLLMQYAVPAIIAMTASSLYNMVDSIFIGHGVGTMAISGLALTFPLMNLAAAFGSLVGVGASTLISVKLGQKDYDTAQKVLGNVFVLNILLGLAFTVVVMAFLDPILYFFGGSENTVGYARDYMEIILLGNVVTHMYLGLNAVLRSAGYPKKAMYATIATVVINTILDPLFIYGFHWGIRGAAIATILAQMISLAWATQAVQQQERVVALPPGYLQIEAQDCNRLAGHRPLAFHDERGGLLHRDSHQPGLEALRGRYGHRRLWYCQPPGVCGGDDCHGLQPGYATHCGLQLRGAALRPCHQGPENYHWLCHGRDHLRLPGGDAGARPGGGHLHVRRGADCHVGPGPAHHGAVLPHHWFPDGGGQFLPEHRNGGQGHLLVPLAAIAHPRALVAHPPHVLWRGRGVV